MESQYVMDTGLKEDEYYILAWRRVLKTFLQWSSDDIEQWIEVKRPKTQRALDHVLHDTPFRPFTQLIAPAEAFPAAERERRADCWQEIELSFMKHTPELVVDEMFDWSEIRHQIASILSRYGLH